jgi:hypothetical protein
MTTKAAIGQPASVYNDWTETGVLPNSTSACITCLYAGTTCAVAHPSTAEILSRINAFAAERPAPVVASNDQAPDAMEKAA